MVDAVASVLLDKLVTFLLNEGRQLLEFNDQIEEIQNELIYMQSTLAAADRVKREDKDPVLQTVTRNLRELVYDVDDIIADCELLNRHQRHVPKFIRYCSLTRLRIGKQMKKTNKKIGKLKENIICYIGPAPQLISKIEGGKSRPSAYPILIDEEDIVGLEDDSKRIREWMLGANEPQTIIGIVGMGGIGKTTLAQKIINSIGTSESFKYSFLVVVSQNFKLDELLKEMLRNLNVEENYFQGKKVEKLLKKLKKELNDGKYSIVLDDVWETDEGQWWNSLRSALPPVTGSCIIVTTRNENVAKSMGATNSHIHRLQILLNEDSWSLFSKVAFAKNGGKCLNSDLECIGRRIVASCEGLPLAIKMVAGLMLQKGDIIDEWKRISENLKEELVMSKKDELIISRLILSYEELPAYLKPCLLSFAIYPTGRTFSVTLLVYFWIAEGFVWRRNGKTAFEIGMECFVELINRGLIIGQKKNIYENGFLSCRVHDMVSDMIIKIAREENFGNFIHSDKPLSNVQSRRVAIGRSTALEKIKCNSKLRTLLAWSIDSKEIMLDIKIKLSNFRWLRVLHLRFSSTEIDKDSCNEDLLSGIGSLLHLIFLCIERSAITALPNSIKNLYNLLIFHLSSCPNFERLPSSIASLEKLTTISISRCDSLKCLPEEIAQLSNLEDLFWLNLEGNVGFRISQLKNLPNLRRLGIRVNYKEEQFDKGEWRVLSILEHLRVLQLNFGNFIHNAVFSEKLDCLQLSPLKCLKRLRVWNISGGERAPAWLNPTSFPNLQFLYINGGNMKCMGSKFLDSTCGVWKVEGLVLHDLKELEEEWSNITEAMPSLRLLKVEGCPKLKSFPFDVTARGFLTWRKLEQRTLCDLEESGA